MYFIKIIYKYVDSILDGMWYRIICDTLKPGKLVKVHSIDLGNVAFLNSKNMKKLPAELLFHPVHVYLCILGTYSFHSFMNININCNWYYNFLDTSINLNSINVEKLKKYENTDCEFTVQKKLGGKNHYLIKCPFFDDLLK